MPERRVFRSEPIDSHSLKLEITPRGLDNYCKLLAKGRKQIEAINSKYLSGLTHNPPPLLRIFLSEEKSLAGNERRFDSKLKIKSSRLAFSSNLDIEQRATFIRWFCATVALDLSTRSLHYVEESALQVQIICAARRAVMIGAEETRYDQKIHDGWLSDLRDAVYRFEPENAKILQGKLETFVNNPRLAKE